MACHDIKLILRTLSKPLLKPEDIHTRPRSKTNRPPSSGLFQELVVSSPNERNWRGIFIALLVIVAVLGLIVFSIVLVSPPEEGPRVRGRKPTLEDIFVKLPPPPRFNGTWISGKCGFSTFSCSPTCAQLMTGSCRVKVKIAAQIIERVV